MYLVVRRWLDFFIAIFLVILLAPLFLITAVLIKIDSSGPVFFKQKRIGKNGKVFKIIKFRSMIVNAQKEGSGNYSLANDSRITKIGSFLRKTSIDELPQLFNILSGKMAFVGPRAPVYGYFPDYNLLNETIKKRFSVPPGITGYAQCKVRNNCTWEEKITLDNIYVDKVKKYGILFDIKIWFMTVLRVLSRKDVQESEENIKKNQDFFDKIINDERSSEVNK